MGTPPPPPARRPSPGDDRVGCRVLLKRGGGRHGSRPVWTQHPSAVAHWVTRGRGTTSPLWDVSREGRRDRSREGRSGEKGVRASPATSRGLAPRQEATQTPRRGRDGDWAGRDANRLRGARRRGLVPGPRTRRPPPGPNTKLSASRTDPEAEAQREVGRTAAKRSERVGP